ncbi:MAG TPA: response regulator [Acidimicrobiales bacterium]|jgi:DNA-binding response OmpR family regulator|nr:response regulator [Acidimicrobiales bacterium]
MARVLIVDDEAGIRELCRVNLALAGYDVVEAADGFAAIEAAKRDKPDLIFLDVLMPGMSGWEVLSALRAEEATASIPVVMLTALNSEDDQIRGWEGGVVEYLTKPFNPLSLPDWAAAALEPLDPAEGEARRQRAVAKVSMVRALRK